MISYVLVAIAIALVSQGHAVERIGSQKPVQLDVRLVAATNRNLEQMVAQGTFREDLLYRLRVVPMSIPTVTCADIACQDTPGVAFDRARRISLTPWLSRRRSRVRTDT